MEPKRIMKVPSGVITPPPSKSLAHRAILCAALAVLCSSGNHEHAVIENVATSEDMQATLLAVEALGATYVREGDTIQIFRSEGSKAEKNVIDCKESGSTLRFMIPIALALNDGETQFTGKGRLLERPLEPYQQAFQNKNIQLTLGQTLLVKGKLSAGRYDLPGNVSSQFISGLLFALPLLDGDSEIRLTTPLESADYVLLTIQVIAHYGICVNQPDQRTFIIKGGQQYQIKPYTVESDYSQSAYFLAAGALGCRVRLAGLNSESMQGDRKILQIIRDMGGIITGRDGLIGVEAEKLLAVTVDVSAIPDLVPPLAVLCCFCEGTSHIVNAARLRYKESDRLHALASELSKLGATITETENALAIEGQPYLAGGMVSAHNDHRIAMAMALAAIRCRQPVLLTGADSVKKSYPEFWQDFEKEAHLGYE